MKTLAFAFIVISLLFFCIAQMYDYKSIQTPFQVSNGVKSILFKISWAFVFLKDPQFLIIVFTIGCALTAAFRKQNFNVTPVVVLSMFFVAFLILYLLHHYSTTWESLSSLEKLIFVFLMVVNLSVKGIILSFPAVTCYLVRKITQRGKEERKTPIIAFKTIKCPLCGAVYRSNPIICSQCGAILSENEGEKIRK
ncbi:MAG: hypothetical protein ACTSXJ_03360 [Candidatus Baldrarchaeia archaeon]